MAGGDEVTWLDDVPFTVEIALGVGALRTTTAALAYEIETETGGTGSAAIGVGAIEEGWGADGWFTIGTTTYGEIETGVGRIADETVTDDDWVDVTEWVRAVSITRRKQSRFNPVDPATLSLTLDDGDLRFEPLNTTGPYTSGGVSYCRQGRRVRVYVTWMGARRYLFTGFVSEWPADMQPFPSAYRTVRAWDWFGMLSTSDFAAQASTGGGESVTSRVRRWLDLYGVPAVEQNIGESDVLVQATTLAGTALAGLRAAVASDGGEAWVSGDGNVVFRSRAELYAENRVNTVNWTVTNAASLGTNETRSAGVPRVKTHLGDTVTRVNLQRVGGTVQTVYDSALTDLYGVISHTDTNLVNNSDTDVSTLAGWLLGWQSVSPFVVESVEIRPDVFDHARGLACCAQLFDRIGVVHEDPGGYTVDREGLVIGVTHTIDGAARSPTWRTVLQLQDVTDVHAFEIGTSDIESNDPIL